MSFPLPTCLAKLDMDGGMIEWVGRKLPERYQLPVRGTDRPPSHKPGQYPEGKDNDIAARVYEVRPERAAHLTLHHT